MLSRVASCLRCPLCHGGLADVAAGTGHALRCPTGHGFDVAKQGYVNLACPAPPYPGDSTAMVEARQQFLGAGHYAFIARAVASTTASVLDPTRNGLIVEAGAGTGYYIASVLDATPGCSGLALDVSKAALRRAAKAHPRCDAALCDVWRELPVADGAASLVLSVFAPRNGAEFRRILAPDGALVVVTPTSQHLAELVDSLGLLSVDPNKDDTVAASLEEHFERVSHARYERSLDLSHKAVAALVGMGPSAWHVAPDEFAARIGALGESIATTASVDISAYGPRHRGARVIDAGTEPRP